MNRLLWWLIDLLVFAGGISLLVWAIERYWPWSYAPVKRGVQLIIILVGVVAFLQYVGLP